jgi:hypothetical protein
MKKEIKIKTDQIEVQAELNNSKIANLIWQTLPIKAKLNTWGEEIYFTIPVKAKIDNPQEVVEKGDLGYWPDGPAFCIFFGQTPISTKDEIKPASAVEIVGKINGDADEFKKVSSGTIILEKIE